MSVDGNIICQIDVYPKDNPDDIKTMLAKKYQIPKHYIYFYPADRRLKYADTPDGRVYIERY